MATNEARVPDGNSNAVVSRSVAAGTGALVVMGNAAWNAMSWHLQSRGLFNTISDAIGFGRSTTQAVGTVGNMAREAREAVVDTIRNARRLDRLVRSRSDPESTAPNGGRSGNMEDEVQTSSDRTGFAAARGCPPSKWLGETFCSGRTNRYANYGGLTTGETEYVSRGFLPGCKYRGALFAGGINQSTNWNLLDPPLGTGETERASRCLRLRGLVVRLVCANDLTDPVETGINVIRFIVWQDMMSKGAGYSDQWSLFTAASRVSNSVFGMYDPDVVPERFRIYADKTYLIKGAGFPGASVKTSTATYSEEFLVNFPPGAVIVYKPGATGGSGSDVDMGLLSMAVFCSKKAYVSMQWRVTYDDAADVT